MLTAAAILQDADQEDVKAITVQLRRVESQELIVFPETAEGYVDKARSKISFLGAHKCIRML